VEVTVNRQNFYFSAGDLPQLRELRIERGWSIRKLAEKAGVAPSTIYEIERGARRAHERTAQKLAKALGVERADLLFPAEQVEVWKAQYQVDNETLRRQLVPLMFTFTDRELKQLLLDSPLRRRVMDIVEREQRSHAMDENVVRGVSTEDAHGLQPGPGSREEK
jgi:transcriptional regulator with XRE-family HTH domain